MGRLATLQISVGTDLHRLVEIHLGVVSSSPEVEIEVCVDQAVVHKEAEEEGSLQWLKNSPYGAGGDVCIPPSAPPPDAIAGQYDQQEN